MNIPDIITRACFRDRITTELLEWVNTRLGEEYYKVDGEVLHSDDCGMCECCEERFRINDLSDVSVQAHLRCFEQWCSDCRSEYAFYCNNNDVYYRSNVFTEVVIDGQSYCLERNDEICFWERDEEYHFEPEPSQDDETEDCGGVAGYHNLNRPWECKPVNPQAIGVELETYAEDARDHAAKAMSLGLLAERDGSLCSIHGVEIIGPPLLMPEYTAPSSPWKKLFDQSSFRAWDAGSGYGMHVNINREGLNKLQQAKLVTFIHGNRPFCEQIAGRREIHWAKYSPKRLGTVHRSSDKYEAAALRKGRIEIRIFRATKKWTSFLRNIEFCDAVRAYVLWRPNWEIALPDFLDFTTAQIGRWPNFVNWLSEKGVA